MGTYPRIDDFGTPGEGMDGSHVANDMERSPMASGGPLDPDLPPVLARMPDLTAGESAAGRTIWSRRRREEGRLLGSPLAVPALLASGLVLVLLAVVPLVLGKKDADSGGADNPSNWHPEAPAPSAPMAARWDGGAAASNPDNVRADGPRHLDWSNASQSAGWGSRPETPIVSNQPTAMTPSGQQNASGGVQQGVDGWRDPGRWPYGVVAGQEAAPSDGASPPLGTTGNPILPPDSGYEASRPAPAYRDYYRQPQSSLNQSMSVTDRRLSSPRYQGRGVVPYQQQPDYTNQNQGAGPPSVYPSTGYPEFPNNRFQKGLYPNSGRPNPDPPASGNPTDPYQSGAYPAPNFSVRAYSTPSGSARPSGEYSEPGVARFQGVIEKPTIGMNHDRDRTSLY